VRLSTATSILASIACACGQTLTLSEAVDRSVRQYPSIRVTQEQVRSAAAQIGLARTAYLPRVEATAQADRATHNNIFGLILPTSGILSSVTGPVLNTNSGSNVWNSTAGFLVAWEPFDFGLRAANVAVAEAGRNRAEAAVARSQFELTALTADAYLTVLAAEQTVKAAQAGVERAETIRRIVDALVRSELRPGADLSRATAELAVAQTQAIQADQAVALGKAALAQLTGADLAQLEVVPAHLLDLPPPEDEPAGTSFANNPILKEQASVIEEAKARLHSLERTYFPKFQLEAMDFARGSGTLLDGRSQGGANGLGPNINNWAVGFTATFSLMDLPGLRAKEAAQAATIRAESSRSDQIVAELRGRLNAAQATLTGARRIAAVIPAELEAARAGMQQATARYQSGLGNVVEVAEAQRLLIQAEINDSLARLGIWRAELAVATANGDLRPFLEKAAR